MHLRRVFLYGFLLVALNHAIPVQSAKICPVEQDTPIPLADNQGFSFMLDDITFKILYRKRNPTLPNEPVVDRDRALGTATLVSPQGYLLTARHPFQVDGGAVLKAVSNGEASLFLQRYDFQTGERATYPATLVDAAAEGIDIALLKVDLQEQDIPSYLPRLNYKLHPAYFDARMMAYKLDSDAPTLSEIGSVHDYDEATDSLKINLPIYHGYSGGLVINQYGGGFGVLSGKYMLPDSLNSYEELDYYENKVAQFSGIKFLLEACRSLDFPAVEAIASMLTRTNRSTETYSMTEKMLGRLIQKEPLGAIKLTVDLEGELAQNMATYLWYPVMVFYDCVRSDEDVRKFVTSQGHHDQIRKFARYKTDRAREYLAAHQVSSSKSNLSLALNNFDTVFQLAESGSLDGGDAALAFGMLDYKKALELASVAGLPARADAPNSAELYRVALRLGGQGATSTMPPELLTRLEEERPADHVFAQGIGPAQDWWNDMFGDGYGDFNMSMSGGGRAWGRGYDRWRDYYGYGSYGSGAPFGYGPYGSGAPSGYGPYGSGAPSGYGPYGSGAPFGYGPYGSGAPYGGHGYPPPYPYAAPASPSDY